MRPKMVTPKKKIVAIVALIALILLGPSVVSAQIRERRVEITNNGWKLIGDLTVPRSFKPLAAVILLNKANGNRHVYARLAQHLAANNIASLRIDLRAHGDSINKGKFVPFQQNAAEIMNGADTDIWAVTQYLRKLKGIDPQRIGYIGASYSGEEMAVSSRKNGYQKAYVALSPGSFSDESLDAIDGSKSHWLFVRSVEERSMRTFPERLHAKSKTSQMIEVPGTKHATDIIESSPEIAEMIAVWFKNKL